MIIDDFSNPKRKLTVSEASAANDYFTRRKSEEDRIAGVKAPAKNKKNPANTDYAKRRKQQDIEESRPFRGTGGAFNRGDDERHDLDPSDWYKVKDGKMFRVSIYPRQVAQAEREGYSRTQAEAKAAADSQGVAEGSEDTIYPNAEVIKSKNGKPVGEIYQDGNYWGAFHYRADRGYDFIDSREEAIEALKDLHQETGRSRPDYTIKGVAEGSGGNWYIRVNGKILNDTKFKPVIFSSEDEARSHAMKLADKKRIPLSQMKLTKSWMDAPEQGVAEGSDQPSKKDAVIMSYLDTVSNSPTGTPDGDFLTDWQYTLEEEFGIEMDTAVLANLLPQLDSQVEMLMNKYTKTMNNRGMYESEQGVAENDLDRFKKYTRPVVKTTPKIEKTTNPAGRTTDHIEWKVTTPTGEIYRYKSKKQAQEHFDSFGQQGVAEGSLEELANTSLKVKEPKNFVNTNDRKQVVYKVMKFKSGKDTYLINFTVKSAPAFGKKQNWNAVNVSFGVREEQDDYSFGDEINTDLTARNKKQFLIYSTVINAIRKFITEYNTEIDEIIMQGAGERQAVMYQRFFQSAGKYFPGWHHDGKHSLVRDVPRQTGKKVKEQGMAEGSESGPVEAYGYRYNNRDQRVMWRKIFSSGEAAYAWADRNNATVLGTRSTEQSLKENAEDLHIGDPVIITGNGIEFEGATGEIIDFGQQHRFVVVNLYNQGRHSFHSSDVSFNEYAGSDDEEARMYDAGEFGDDYRNEMDEARTSAAQRLSTAWDRQRAKSDASLRRTPSSIPKTVDKERIIRDIATSNASPEHKKVAIDAVMKTMSESRAGRRALMATMLNSR